MSEPSPASNAFRCASSTPSPAISSARMSWQAIAGLPPSISRNRIESNTHPPVLELAISYGLLAIHVVQTGKLLKHFIVALHLHQIGRASCRERVCQYV